LLICDSLPSYLSSCPLISALPFLLSSSFPSFFSLLPLSPPFYVYCPPLSSSLLPCLISPLSPLPPSVGGILLTLLSKFATCVADSVDGKGSTAEGVEMNDLYGGARISYIFNEVKPIHICISVVALYSSVLFSIHLKLILFVIGPIISCMQLVFFSPTQRILPLYSPLFSSHHFLSLFSPLTTSSSSLLPSDIRSHHAVPGSLRRPGGRGHSHCYRQCERPQTLSLRAR
jgi:hypothetical protein